MKRKILCYDLHGADSSDYQEVYNYIEDTFYGTRATDSVYILYSSKSNKELCDIFLNKFGNDVSILVNDFPKEASFRNIKDYKNWMYKISL